MQFDKTISGRVVTPLKVIDNGCIGIKAVKTKLQLCMR